MITANHSKELLCRSYLVALAGGARQNVLFGRELDYGVDGSFKHVEKRGKRLHESGIALDFQAKVSANWKFDGANVVYDLEKKTFNDLVGRGSLKSAAPFYLILLCLPDDEAKWATFGADELVIRKCAYFARPTGIIASDEIGTKRIRIPVADALTPASLTKLLEDIKSGAIQP